MSKRAAILGLGMVFAWSVAPAGAAGLSMNEVELRAGATLDECRALGRAAIAQAGLAAMPEAPSSVFGTTPSNELATIYCLPQRGIANQTGRAGDHDLLARHEQASLLLLPDQVAARRGPDLRLARVRTCEQGIGLDYRRASGHP